jgi:hypothetical protein
MIVEILHVGSGQYVEAEISLINEADSEPMGDRSRFKEHDWKDRIRMNFHELYKLEYNSTIMGLMHLKFNHPLYPDTVEIYLIEKSTENRGDTQEYHLIAECLISFACNLSLEKFSGKVIVEPLEKYKALYQEKYLLKPGILKVMESSSKNSKRLVRQYLSK